jgi:lipopolysaccharide export system protein LptA
LKINYLLAFAFSLSCYGNTNISIGENNILVDAQKIEINKKDKEIYFKDGLNIKNEYIFIHGNSAIFNNKNKILNISGNKAKIRSNSLENPFSGSANSIFIYSDNSIELNGDAVFQNDGITFKSSSIKFNQQNGRIIQ